MCDTMVVVRPDGVLFAKNSDRDPNEAQIPEWHAAADHHPDSTVSCTYLEIPQVAHTNAILISRPFWMWGAEIGANEHGVVIGNEAVFTDQPYAEMGLTGMDLLRLALERAGTATDAVQVLVSLLEEHGQGGGCGHEDRSFTYHNSFLVADPGGAVVLETAGRKWATETVESGVRTISNGLTITGFAEAHRDRLRSHISACDVRSTLTARAAERALGPTELMAALRSHAPDRWPRYRLVNGTLSMPCMHGGGMLAASSSTAGWVADLASGLHWTSATSAQCLSLFKPARVDTPVDIGAIPDDRDDGKSLWWRHERLARTVMRDPEQLAPLFLGDRDSMEQAWLADPPSSQEAFDEGSGLVDLWADKVAGVTTVRDVRPWWVRRYWAKREVMAGAA